MKLIDIIQKSESFSFYVNSIEVAERTIAELQKYDYEYLNPEMHNMFTDSVTGRSNKYVFEIRPKVKKLGVRPHYGSCSLDINSIEHPIFSQDIMIFILWILKNEGAF